MLTLTKGKNKKKKTNREDSMPSIFRKKKPNVFLKANVSFAQLCTGKCAIEVLYFYNAFRAEAYRMHWIQCALLILKCDIIVNALKLVIKLYIFYEEEKKSSNDQGYKIF